MSETRSVFNDAAISGLALGAVSISYELLNHLGKSIESGVIAGSLAVLLWIAKFVGCILLLRFFMKRYSLTDSQIDNSQTFRFGVVTALYSALLYAAFYFIYVVYIVPDIFEQSFAMIRDSYSQSLPAESMEQIENMMGNLPTISFFAMLIYCFLFGTILSAILSRNIPSRNPFE